MRLNEMTYNEIISEINLRIVKYKTELDYKAFFIDYTDSLERKVIGHHLQESDWLLTFHADSSEVAQRIVEYFSTLGMATNYQAAKNDVDGVWVYCYEITMHTREYD